MAGIWHYTHDGCKIGPFTAWQLKELADAGMILSSDIVWKEGVEKGVLASRVKNLFAIGAVGVPVVSMSACDNMKALKAGEPKREALAATAKMPDAVIGVSAQPEAPPPAPPEKMKAQQEPSKKKGRAVAGKGADIVSQDGVQAKYRKKCVECGHKDSATQMVTLTNKTVRANFFCPKCRKRREVSVQCFSK